MCIILISSVVFKNNRFEIGYDNELLYRITEDQIHFRNTTIGHTVIMGYKTWVSLPENNRPLKNRTNIVLTRTPDRYENTETVIFTTFEQFMSTFPVKSSKKYFVIGGGEIFTLFLENNLLKPDELILTHISPDISVDADSYVDPDLISDYKITKFSKEYVSFNMKHRYIYYKLNSETHQEIKYMKLMKKIMKQGITRTDRTNTGTVSLFGESLRFDISESIPLMTTKRVSFKNIVEELLWFCKGETDAKILAEKGVNIWNGNSTREFLDSRGLYSNEVGDCGPIYGHQWRRFGKRPEDPENTGVDQLKYVEDLLKNDPFSRRIVISAWNPFDSKKMALLPCHMQVQWYVTNNRRLNCMFTMRSSDFALAGCYNIVSYSILTYILAKRHNLKPGEIVYNSGDCHIYSNHFEAVKEQMKMGFRPWPCLEIDDSIEYKNWEEMESSDFNLVGYFPNRSIKMKMAV